MERKGSFKRYIPSLVSTPLFVGLPFLSAGTLHYFEAWTFIVNFSVCTTIHTIYLAKNDPALLERRMKAGPTAEQRPEQRIVMWAMMIGFMLLLVVPGLDHRFGWSHVPLPFVIIGNLLVLASFVGFYLVCRENTFASATIELAEGQKVISTGPYGVVRHPMYAWALLMLLGMPLALGSYWALLLVAALAPVLHLRIVDEEKLLNQQLAGYADYCSKVRYRLLPPVY